jgi:ribosomal silencing factor RsfS
MAFSFEMGGGPFSWTLLARGTSVLAIFGRQVRQEHQLEAVHDDVDSL